MGANRPPSRPWAELWVGQTKKRDIYRRRKTDMGNKNRNGHAERGGKSKADKRKIGTEINRLICTGSTSIRYALAFYNFEFHQTHVLVAEQTLLTTNLSSMKSKF